MYKIYLASKYHISSKYDLFSKLTKWWTNSKYYHSEIFIDFGNNYGKYYSSTFLKGPRHFFGNKNDNIFDYLDISYMTTPKEVENYYNKTKGSKYDILGIFGFLARFVKGSIKKFFCSEWCANPLKIFTNKDKTESYKLSPDLLHLIVLEKQKSYNKGLKDSLNK